jgi:methenyltetrahydrofolate cyclohydrolase
MAEPDARFADLTLAAFIERLASADPTPGGGSASAAAASLGAALVAMVAQLSLDRPRYAPYAATHQQALSTATRLRARFLELADEDASAYGAFGAARKLPKETVDEQAAREGAIRTAARAAADVPMDMVRACHALIAEVEALAGRSNLNAASDLDVAALLTSAAARGAAANVLINLPSVGDDAYTGMATAEVEGYLHDIDHITAQVHRTVLKGELRDPESR